MKMYFRIIASVLLAVMLLGTVCACSQKTDNGEPSADDVSSNGDSSNTEPSGNPDTDPAGTTAGSEDTDDGKQTNPHFITNRLTGEVCDEATANRRPVAIMINNIKKANPQIGISGAQVIYECEVEGGITRLMMLTTDYSTLSVVGSIRSAREYFIDYAMGHDAIFVHAGGSEQAYAELASRSVDHIDGTRGKNPADTFYRDPKRLQTMGSVHAYVTSGDRIAKAVDYFNFRTEIPQGTQTSFAFVAPGTADLLSDGEKATHLYMSYTASHCPEFVYDEASGKYLRFQFKHEPQIDDATGKQLAFDNVIVISCQRTNLNDAKGHIDIVTSGEGKGYYCYKGKAIPIRYSKANDDAPLRFYRENGEELLLNTGTTFVNVLGDSQFERLSLNYTN